MQITINGETLELQQPQPLSELLAGRADLPDNFAIAVNEVFVPRSAYGATRLEDGDQVELLVPMQGG